MSLVTLLSARAGLESVRNTPVTPTRLLYFGEGTHNQEVGTVTPRERRASYAPHYRHYPGVERNSFEFAGDVTFDDLIWWLNVAEKAVASGTGAGGDKTWTFLPTLTSDDVKSATLEFAPTDLLATVGWRVPGLMADRFAVRWPLKSSNEPVSFDATLVTAKGATQITAFTGALSDRATISALSTATQVFVDTTTIGTTADARITEVGFELTNGFVHFDPLDNTGVAAAVYRPEAKAWTLTAKRYFSDKTELDTYIAKTARKVRVQTVGPSLGGSNYRIRLDCYGVWEAHDTAEADGLIMADLALRPVFDSGISGDHAWEIVNATASIT